MLCAFTSRRRLPHAPYLMLAERFSLLADSREAEAQASRAPREPHQGARRPRGHRACDPEPRAQGALSGRSPPTPGDPGGNRGSARDF